DRALHRLKHITIGGDRCKPNLVRTILQRLPSVKPYITYGLSEAGPRVSTLPPELFGVFPASVGFPLPGVEVSVVDNSGRACGRGQTGEIAIRTPSVMKGYFRDEERTAKRLHEGWCFSGDLGVFDQQGLLYLQGRKDREFKFRGRKVSPESIERILYSHPLVQDVRIVKVETEEGDSLRAFLKARAPSQQALAAELKRICRRQLPAYLVPAEFEFYGQDVYHFKGKPGNQIRNGSVASHYEP
ncbi:MAG: class I adenylate-forming enzyme family protein, partial [Desulfuromonadales bacterium]